MSENEIFDEMMGRIPRPSASFCSPYDIPLCPPHMYEESSIVREVAWEKSKAFADQVGADLSREKWESERNFHLEYVAAKNIVEEYLRDPWTTNGEDRFEQLRIVNRYGYRYAQTECPIMNHGQILPTDDVGKRRILTFSTEAWAQRQRIFECENVIDPSCTEPRALPVFSGALTVGPHHHITRQDTWWPHLTEDGKPAFDHINRGFHSGHNSLSAVIQQWVEEDDDNGAFLRLLEKHPNWEALLDERYRRVTIEQDFISYLLPANPSVQKYVSYLHDLRLSGEIGIKKPAFPGYPRRGCLIQTFFLGYGKMTPHQSEVEWVTKYKGQIPPGEYRKQLPGRLTGVVQQVHFEGQWIPNDFMRRVGVDRVLGLHRKWVQSLPLLDTPPTNKRKEARFGRRPLTHLDQDMSNCVAGKMTIKEVFLCELGREMATENFAERTGENRATLEAKARQAAWNRVKKRAIRLGITAGQIPPKN